MPKVYFKKLLEVACFSVESCIKAQESGADRIEFCANYSLGGITPNHEEILRANELLNIPLHIIIRPRGGNFTYTAEEISVMKNDILFCKANGINGVVFGVLNSENEIDETICKELIELSMPMSITFHRAIDECKNIEDAFINLIKLGFTRVLTSGGRKSALDGIIEIKNCQIKFGDDIILMPGGGIRSSNIENIISETNCHEYHSAAIVYDTDLVNDFEVKLLKEKIHKC
jgi:copper homeostasis protein